ncbi:hypothetical protein F8O53_00240 [Enterobacter sp. 63]
MRLNVIGDIIEVFDDYGKKAGSVVLSRHPRHRNKPYSDGKGWHTTKEQALLALITRKRLNVKL